MSDIILDAYMQFENYPIKTVGVEAFYSYYILYDYFKISKIRQKFKNSPIVEKSTIQAERYYTWWIYAILKAIWLKL